MNDKQLTLYWREWRACRDALKALGKPCDDDVRHALQADAIGGFTKSSKKLTNAELTRVLARFRSYSRPGDLNAQLHAENEPEARREAQLAEIERLAGQVGIKGGLAGVSTYFKKYLGGKAVGIVDANTLRKLAYILRRRLAEVGAGEAPSAKPAAEKPACTRPANLPPAEDVGEWDGQF